MECLSAVFSIPLFTADLYNPFLFHYTCLEKRRTGYCSAMLDSLINTALHYKENGKIPYVGRVAQDTNRLRLSQLCFFLVGVLLTREHQLTPIASNISTDIRLLHIRQHGDFCFKEEREILQKDGERINTLMQEEDRIFSYVVDPFAKSLAFDENEQKLKRWITNFTSILRNPYEVEHSILPFSMKVTELFDEGLYAFFRICHMSSRFKSLMVMNKKSASLTYIFIYHLVELYFSADDPHLFDILISLLMDLSGDKDYCLNLNQGITESVLIKRLPVISGSYLNLCFITFCYLLLDAQVFVVYHLNFLAILKNL